MEVLGLSHPAVSTAAANMQKLVDQARPTPISEAADSPAEATGATKEQVALDLKIDEALRPVNATSESVLEARAPVETYARQTEATSGGEVPPDSETYEFPEKLPMNFLEMIDMWRVDEAAQPVQTASSDGMSVADPASAAEAQRLNRTA